ncbi:type II toxin-antitoxin system ParD family antitoxin [Methylobacterium sp. J-077]|uniref:ribbon-helix-helix domain-containing protein n=1 Tax=Methylobacterium sp. J-077 TaxID=2836656 RepID=UPI001FBA16DB|nr:type II toxin-antitoxin system ParD family antitoxin [Methylobacterium sp. J-077]MCJ2125202.1 type II toxin-antitoxin system ParD family antitoxin [Methylobacterium sp. J-077]
MAAKHPHHVALTAAHSAYVTDQVAKGHYASVSEVVRAGLRLLIERDNVRTDPSATASHGVRREV